MASRLDRTVGSLVGFYAGDALAMPVHWYYDTRQLRDDFGKITKYEAPKPRFPGSIMNLSNTGGGGRGSDQGDIVGTVILHGKKEFWKKGGNCHYHHGMKAGENTLDALVTKVLTKSMIKQGEVDPRDCIESYIKFMTTKGSHNDTYAGTCHRMFFKNLVDGRKPEDCPDNDSHNVDAIDALMILPPVVLAHYASSPEVRSEAIRKAIQATRNTEAVLRYANIYSDMLLAVFDGTSIPEAAIEAGKQLNYDIAKEVRMYGDRQDPMVACYIASSFPAMLYFAHKYGDNYESLLLASANAGGENVARGSLLGALAGARFGLSGTPNHLKSGLVAYDEIVKDSQDFAKVFGLSDSSNGGEVDSVVGHNSAASLSEPALL